MSLNFAAGELIRTRYSYLPLAWSWRFLALLGFLFTAGDFFILSAAPSFAGSHSARGGVSPQCFMEQGLKAFQRGDFERSVLGWLEASRLYQAAGRAKEQSEALTHLAHA
ncbi:MAG: hypothetical protein O6837_13180, partial [Deltaproteobacteria bacterium]|nr:hypothetical protein [Deltaproteobacteria bacterium]